MSSKSLKAVMSNGFKYLLLVETKSETYTVIPHFIYIQIMLYSVELKAA